MGGFCETINALDRLYELRPKTKKKKKTKQKKTGHRNSKDANIQCGYRCGPCGETQMYMLFMINKSGLRESVHLFCINTYLFVLDKTRLMKVVSRII